MVCPHFFFDSFPLVHTHSQIFHRYNKYEYPFTVQQIAVGKFQSAIVLLRTLVANEDSIWFWESNDIILFVMIVVSILIVTAVLFMCCILFIGCGIFCLLSLLYDISLKQVNKIKRINEYLVFKDKFRGKSIRAPLNEEQEVIFHFLFLFFFSILF